MKYLIAQENLSTCKTIKDFDNFFDNCLRLSNDWGFDKPSVDVLENDNEYVLTIDLPGFLVEEVKLSIKDQKLTFITDKTLEEDKNKYLLKERSPINYKRTFALPIDVDKENIQAEMRNGILKIVIGKNPEKKELEIKIKNKFDK